MRRNLYDCPCSIKVQVYKTLVRPILNYSASVRDPHTQSNIKQIEAVQNRAARFVFGDYRPRSSVTQMKKELEWEDLKIRRTFSTLSIFHQAISSHLAITATTSLRPVEQNLRHTSQTANSFIPISTRKDCLKHSFLPKTVIHWNSLPANIINLSDKDQFKSAIYKYLTSKEFLTISTLLGPTLLGLPLLLGVK